MVLKLLNLNFIRNKQNPDAYVFEKMVHKSDELYVIRYDLLYPVSDLT